MSKCPLAGSLPCLAPAAALSREDVVCMACAQPELSETVLGR